MMDFPHMNLLQGMCIYIYISYTIYIYHHYIYIYVCVCNVYDPFIFEDHSSDGPRIPALLLGIPNTGWLIPEADKQPSRTHLSLTTTNLGGS